MKEDRVSRLLAKKFFDEIEIRSGTESRVIRGMWGARFYERGMKDGPIIKTSKPHFLISASDARGLKKGDTAIFRGELHTISAVNDAKTGLVEVELREEYEGELAEAKAEGEQPEQPPAEEKKGYLDKLKG